jgi:WD40 repeat protein
MHSCEVTAVDMAASGALVVSGGADGRVVVWSAVSGFRMAVFTLHSKVIRSVKFDAGEALDTGAEAQDGDLQLVAVLAGHRSVLVWCVCCCVFHPPGLLAVSLQLSTSSPYHNNNSLHA